MASEFHIDSAGTGAWHIGNPPDSRSVDVAQFNGIDISAQRARQLHQDDLEKFDLIIGMDRNNVKAILQKAPAAMRHKVHLFSDYAHGTQVDVPDPYYGGADGFTHVYNMLSAGCTSILEKLKSSE